jgi:hypothetical protein
MDEDQAKFEEVLTAIDDAWHKAWLADARVAGQ